MLRALKSIYVVCFGAIGEMQVGVLHLTETNLRWRPRRTLLEELLRDGITFWRKSRFFSPLPSSVSAIVEVPPKESHRWKGQLPANIRRYRETPGSPGEPTSSVGPGASTAPASLKKEAVSLGREHPRTSPRPGAGAQGGGVPGREPGLLRRLQLRIATEEASSPGAVGHPGFGRDPTSSHSLRPSVRGRHQTQLSTGERSGTVLRPRHGQREGWVQGKPLRSSSPFSPGVAARAARDFTPLPGAVGPWIQQGTRAVAGPSPGGMEDPPRVSESH
ncbi:hypothetical protein NDU88_003877 [Pleurodeles waltl]|uniref:Uncharacterized protein n=1 Tax=Pleurodeles waltl TaxID=8319 RepID=A0AAV7W3L8_PLEWA|nr:hypothetical protein NDU88_003877 [Pleurodeles waltl]